MSRRLIDVHIHVGRLSSMKVSWDVWGPSFQPPLPLRELYDDDGWARPEVLDAFLAEQGVDVALLISEYSPRVTGIQAAEDLLPLIAHNPQRFRLIGNLNPHYHFPLVDELDRQLALGAVALKLHPVHGNFALDARELYRVYARCEETRVPVVVHTGTSRFPGAVNRYGDPSVLDDIARDFPDLSIVMAHGGRGWWYERAGFLATMHDNVWIDIAGLPPQRLPDYYGERFPRLTHKLIFGSDFPGFPGHRENVARLEKLGLEEETLESILWRNAERVYGVDAHAQ